MENKHTIYFNMCHHYRKIFNAKPHVDTSSPKTLQLKANNRWNNNRVMSVLSRVKETSSPNNAEHHLNKKKNTHQNGEPVICKYYYQHHYKHTASEYNELNHSFAVPKKQFSPMVRLKSGIQDKLRNLQLYHPPRKKKVILKVPSTSRSSRDYRDEKKENVLKCDIYNKSNEVENSTRSSFTILDQNYSEESSEDSAYNEGECILSSDSRGSTPQNNNNYKSAEVLTTAETKPSTSTNLPNTKKEDVVYLQFLKDITKDILQKNIFTNKALKNVFQRHIQRNKYELDSEKMLTEVYKLQERLGVPKDDNLDHEDYGLGKDISVSDNSTSSTEKSNKIKEISSRSNDNNISTNIPAKDIVVADETDEKAEIDNSDYFDENEYSENFSEEEHSLNDDNIDKKPDSVDDETSKNTDVVVSISNEEEIDEVDEVISDKSNRTVNDVHETANDSDLESDSEILEIC